ncbi:flagellar basal-body rod protein FlgF [sulfur-oxidizing endosymbiont of Gigantopelta aegis]|uniref:flagellar basal-body rod protein FlgF n=1 Tax=sulfur-oxidizing endosymbiont of Gigantopelta aegis TaxID=2794934 RepID=UPI0018DDBD02|nr:flagellar basal-body rod protein FlgF [sulfur-oxidizing endosymbiont of Gigantopelta aegis]
MDNFIFVAMSGAKENMLNQQLHMNNLANASTAGFRADFAAARSQPVFGPGLPTRVYSMTQNPGTDFKSGSMISTGNNLDVAITGEGFFAVLDKNGNETYTRAGNFKINETGMLTTGAGHPVLGDGGPVVIPPAKKIDIMADGTISIVPEGAENNATAVIGRLKMVNPDVANLVKNESGLMVQKNAEPAEADGEVRLIAGVLESSNVNAMSEMVDMISLARQYEMQVKLLKKAEEMDQASTQLLRLS